MLEESGVSNDGERTEVTEHAETITTKNAETLLFIKNNFQLLNGQYSY